METCLMFLNEFLGSEKCKKKMLLRVKVLESGHGYNGS